MVFLRNDLGLTMIKTIIKGYLQQRRAKSRCSRICNHGNNRTFNAGNVCQHNTIDEKDTRNAVNTLESYF